MTRSLPLLLALCFTVISLDAAAIYMPPDLTQIPAERIATNLERALDTAETPEEKRQIRMQLARAYAAAFARKSDMLMVHAPVKAQSRLPETEGGLAPVDVRTAFAYMGGRGRPLYGVLSSDLVKSDTYGCDPEALTELTTCEGYVVVRYEVPAEGATAVDIVVAETTVAQKSVEACLQSYVAKAKFKPAAQATQVTHRFDFRPANRGGLPFYGFGAVTVPQRVRQDAEEAVSKRALAFLEKARDHYYAVVKAEPKNPLAHLGLAWVLDQRGDKDKAIHCYRETFKIAWQNEQHFKTLSLGSRPVAAEAARYLMALLDKDKDAEEISRLLGAQTKLQTLPRPVTPIVIPLDASTTLSALVDADAGVAFDLDGSGQQNAWGWIRPNAAWLVYDEGQTGAIRSGLQLFGSVSFWTFWSDGYQALSALDDDGNHALDGDELRHLALWHDANGDGKSQLGEVRPLAAHHIRALRLDATPDASGILTHRRGVEMTDGTARPSWDWVVAPQTAR
ncbi:MAG: tetratricopeptide (TPR) repeat protein [Myxococcota bacterium]|jgi:tetratricopeptide (TPR) repeat protein